jgi:hypothetical protein
VARFPLSTLRLGICTPASSLPFRSGHLLSQSCHSEKRSAEESAFGLNSGKSSLPAAPEMAMGTRFVSSKREIRENQRRSVASFFPTLGQIKKKLPMSQTSFPPE